MVVVPGCLVQCLIVRRQRRCCALHPTSARAVHATGSHSRPAPSLAAGIFDHAAHFAHEIMLEYDIPRLLFDGENIFQGAELAIFQFLHCMTVSLNRIEVGLELRHVRFLRSDGKSQGPHRPHLPAPNIPALPVKGAEK